MVRGGGQLSVLKEGAASPGDLSREGDWEPAERIRSGAGHREEVGREEYAIWTLPKRFATRALRFTHTAQPADPKYAGWLGGALVLGERLTNVAPQAQVLASARDEVASRITDEQAAPWNPWDNGKEGGALLISPEQPEWLMLAWPRALELSGLQALWAGFGAAEVQVFTGTAEEHPREAGESAWRTLKTFEKIENGYPLSLAPNALKFDQAVTTRAVRVRLTAVTTEGHSHLKGNTKNGRRVWLGELMALHPLGDLALSGALLPTAKPETHPPIAVRFQLPAAGRVTLVIEDPAGKRVRNLISEVPFPAGENVAWWDGTDDLGRDRDAARHGLYRIPEQPVAPGRYRVRGLFHKGLDLRYEFSIYNAGSPAWETEDKSGGWLTNHTPPQAALFVPGEQPMVFLGSAVSEGGAGLAWVNLDGKKIGGRGWIGGNWTAAPTLARDAGANAVPEVTAYVGSTWTATGKNEDKTHGELRITALTAKGDKTVLKHPFTPPALMDKESAGDEGWISQLGGIAVHDGIVVASLTKMGSLLLIDARENKLLGETTVADPRGVVFDAKGRLLVLSGQQLLRFEITPPAQLSPPVLLAEDLLDPHGITLDAAGNIFVSDHGAAHQVKVFSPAGEFLRAIGHAGAPKAGRYDPLHMNHPHGLAIDEREQLWVTENDFQPKRVSVWSLDGRLLRAFYGPGRYGGGGSLDPQDKTRFYYDGIEFRLDWKAGTSTPVAVFHRPAEDDFSSQKRTSAPETPIHFQGRQYMVNCFNSNPTGGSALVTIWLMRDQVAVPVASLGRAQDWELLRGEAFASRWPEDGAANDRERKKSALVAWSDLNGDARVQPEEVTIRQASTGGVTVMPDLAFVESRVDENAVRFAPRHFTENGVPVYDLDAGKVVATGVQTPASSGGDQVLISPEGLAVLTIAPQPWAREGFGGVKNGEPLWSYPSLWPGLHASHEAPVPTRGGEVIGTTRLLGGFITPREGDAGPLWCINGNMGTAYLFTADGLFVAQLFQDSRRGKAWSMPTAERGMLLNELTLHDENFFPTIAQTSDGSVYLCDGARTSLVRVDGLGSIRRLPTAELRVTNEDLQAAATWRVKAEAAAAGGAGQRHPDRGFAQRCASGGWQTRGLGRARTGR